MESANPLAIKDTLLALNAPALFGSAIKVEMNPMNRLKEIKLCYDLNLKFTSCM